MVKYNNSKDAIFGENIHGYFHYNNKMYEILRFYTRNHIQNANIKFKYPIKATNVLTGKVELITISADTLINLENKIKSIRNSIYSEEQAKLKLL